jgi:hypothetical protein
MTNSELWERLSWISGLTEDDYKYGEDPEMVIAEAFPEWKHSQFDMDQQETVNDVFRYLRLDENYEGPYLNVEILITYTFLQESEEWRRLYESAYRARIQYNQDIYKVVSRIPNRSSILLLHREWMKNQGFTTIAEEPETEAEISSAEQLKYLIWSPPKPTKSANMVKAPE